MAADSITALVLAAGKGVRMKSDLPKVLHPILGRPMVRYVIDTVRSIGADPVHVVVGFGKERLIEALRDDGTMFVEQPEQLGTGHAAQCFARACPTPPAHLLVVCGDTPLLSRDTLRTMVETHLRERPACTMMTLDMAEPGGYGRILRDRDGNVTEIREAKDCSDDQKKIREVNLAIYLFDGPALYERLFKLTNRNNQKEYYLTDVVGMLTSDGKRVLAIKERDERSTLGINSRADLAMVGDILRRQVLERHMAAGVTILDPGQTWIEPGVKIGAETVIWPGTTLTGTTAIGSRAIIGPQTMISDSNIGDAAVVRFSVVDRTTVRSGTSLPPFTNNSGNEPA
mgnify:FL=1